MKHSHTTKARRRSIKGTTRKHTTNKAFARVLIPINVTENGDEAAMEVPLTLRSIDVAVVLSPEICSDGIFEVSIRGTWPGAKKPEG